MDLNCCLSVSDFESDYSNRGGYNYKLEDMISDYDEEYDLRYGAAA